MIRGLKPEIKKPVLKYSQTLKKPQIPKRRFAMKPKQALDTIVSESHAISLSVSVAQKTPQIKRNPTHDLIFPKEADARR